MKNLTLLQIFITLLGGFLVAQAQEEERVIVISPADTKPVPVFFSGEVSSLLQHTDGKLMQTVKLDVKIVQGEAKRLKFSLSGKGEVTGVTGGRIASWSVTQAEDGKRFLELGLKSPVKGAGEPGSQFSCVVRIADELGSLPADLNLTLIGQGEAVATSGELRWKPDPLLDLKMISSENVSPLGDDASALAFHYRGDPGLKLRVSDSATNRAVEFNDIRIEADFSDGKRRFTIRGRVVVRQADRETPLFKGFVAPIKLQSTSSRLIASGKRGGISHYSISYSKEGEFPFSLELAGPKVFSEGANQSGFTWLPGAIVPVSILGLSEDRSFERHSTIRPLWREGVWRAFLPADGQLSLSWTDDRSEDGKLAFTTEGVNRVEVGAGLVRQQHFIRYQILQGEIAGALELKLDGPGQILDVAGSSVRGWEILEVGDERLLKLSLGSPISKETTITVSSQIALGQFPAQSRTMRLTPRGGVRHSGFISVVNEGAVKIGVTQINGLTQLAPDQFPGGVNSDARQFFGYRFPSKQRDFVLKASIIEPVVKVRQQTVIEFGESDHVLFSKLELDIREAALREFEMSVPADFSVVSLIGAAVADYVVEGEADAGRRDVRIVFNEPVMGRQLIDLRLEKNEGVEVGRMALPSLGFESADSVRGEIGVSVAPGYRANTAEVDALRELAIGLFSGPSDGLQQAYRIRESQWSASVDIEALPQSVQADLFHLYTLKKGVAYGAVLVNYLVIGAPVNEWQIKVPKELVNVTVDGQGIRSWRREGDVIKAELDAPALGSSTLLLTFEQPLPNKDSEMNFGEVQPLQVQSERGFVQLVSPTQVKHEVVSKSEGLLSLEASELPAEFRVLSSSPSLAAWQYSARPLQLRVALGWYEQGGQLSQVVDFASLRSEVGADGQLITSATYFVKSLGNQLMRLQLPEESELWEVLVADERVNARVDQGQLMIPLKAVAASDSAIKVELRYGQKSGAGGELSAPVTESPILASSWKLTGQRDLLLVPGGEREPASRVLTETGFEWLRAHTSWVTAFGGLGVLMVCLFLGLNPKFPIFFRTIAFFGSSVPSFIWIGKAIDAFSNRSVNLGSVEYHAAYLAGGESFSVQVASQPTFWAMISVSGLVLGLIGGLLILFSLLRKPSPLWWRGAAWVLICLGLLAQRGGAVAFYLLVGCIAMLEVVLPILLQIIRDIRNRNNDPDSKLSSSAVASLLLLACLISVAPVKAEESVSQLSQIEEVWVVKDQRIYAEASVTLTAEKGVSIPLMKGNAVMTSFESETLSLHKVTLSDEETQYLLNTKSAGVLKAKLRYEMSLPDLSSPVAAPLSSAAIHSIEVTFDQEGWSAQADGAVMSQALGGLPDGESGSLLVMGGRGAGMVSFIPAPKEEEGGEVKFFVEVLNLVEPKPGVVDARHLILVRPSVGEVDELKCEVPDGFTVSKVSNGASRWKFDPDTRELWLKLSAPKSSPFFLQVSSQMPLGELPAKLGFAPLRVREAESESGMIALAMSEETQAENLESKGISNVAVGDFVAKFAKRNIKIPQPRQSYRYGADAGTVELTVAPVAPDIRVTTEELLSLGIERTVLNTKFNVSIARSGVFKLEFPLPEGMELESLSGPALSDWLEENRDGTTFIKMQLNGKTLGTHSFVASFSGPGVVNTPNWRVPRFELTEARRQNGQLLLVPERGLQVRSIGREHVSRVDSSSQTNQQRGARKGAVAFRLLRQDWTLDLEVVQLEAWLTANVLQECQIREGLTRHRIALGYQIENAAIRELKVRIPGPTDAEIQTMNATGRGVADLVKVEGEKDLWLVKLDRAEIGNLNIQIEWQRVSSGADQDRQELRPVELVGARIQRYSIAARTSGRLDLKLLESNSGWQRADWSSIGRGLIDPQLATAPSLLLSSNKSAGAIVLGVKRHAVANALKLQVKSGELVSAFMPDQSVITSLALEVHVIEKSLMKVELPAEVILFHVHVNSESVSVVREGNAYLFYVLPGAEQSEPSKVQLAYAKSLGEKGITLEGPKFNVPLQNINWKVVLPPGHELKNYNGTLKLEAQDSLDAYELEDYLSFSSSLKESRKKVDDQRLEKANRYLQAGDQEKAGKMLRNLTRSGNLDAASSEDARVQLMELKKEQAIIGLNTRRQRLSLDNGLNKEIQREGEGFPNEYLQGKSNYSPELVNQISQFNSASENQSLRRLADRIVNQQLAVDPVPKMLKIDLPERGVVHSFHRGLQIDGSQALKLDLDIEPARGGKLWISLSVLFLLGGGLYLIQLMKQNARK